MLKTTWLALVMCFLFAAGATLGCSEDELVPSTDAGPTDGVAPDAPLVLDGGVLDAGGLLLPTGTIDLGRADCAGAPVERPARVVNGTGKRVTVTASVVGTTFAATPATLTLAPGEAQDVAVSARVPSTANAGQVLTGTLRLGTDDPARPTVELGLVVQAQGAVLALAPGSPLAADFGQSEVGAPDAPIRLTVVNTGNSAASFAFGAPSLPAFGLAPIALGTLAPGASNTVIASFTPRSTRLVSANSAVDAVGPVCNGSLAQLTFSGHGTLGKVTGWPSAPVDFGANDCGGATAGPQTFTLTNGGTAPVRITGVTLGAKGYTTSLRGNEVLAAGGGTLDVTVRAPPVPFPSEVPGNYDDVILVTTDVPGDLQHRILLTQSARGAVLAFDTSPTPGFGTFGLVGVGTSSAHTLKLVNTGNAPANVTLTTNNARFTASAPFTVAGGTFQEATATFTPTDIQAQNGSLGLASTSVLCSPVPAPKSLSGTGLSGGVGLSTGSLTFSASCGTGTAPGAPPRVAEALTISNTGNVPMTWSGALSGAGSAHYVLSSTGSTIAPGGSQIVQVTPGPIPFPLLDVSPGQFQANLLVSTDVPGDTPHNVALSDTPLGAVLAVEPAVRFGRVPTGESATRSLALQNRGNGGGDAPLVTLTLDGDDASSFGVSPSTLSPAPEAPVPPASTISFTPGPDATARAARITFSVPGGTALCAPLPDPVQLDGEGTQASVIVDESRLRFGPDGQRLVDCGATGNAQVVHVRNTGNQAFRVTGTTLSNTTFYSVSPAASPGAPLLVAPAGEPGSELVLTVTPNPMPSSVPSVFDAAPYSGTLTVVTDAATDVGRQPIALEMQPRGAILRRFPTNTWDFGTVPFGEQGAFSMPIEYQGNVDATLIPGPIAGPPVFATSEITLVAGASTALASATYTPASSSSSSASSVTFSLSPQVPVCQVLPNLTASLLGRSTSEAAFSVTGSLDFPAVDCGSQNAPLSLTLNNTTGSPIPFTYTFDFDNWYDASDDQAGDTVPANGSATITVTPRVVTGAGSDVGSNPYVNRLVIVASLPGGNVSKAVPISQTAHGAKWEAFDHDATDESFNFQNAGDRAGTMSVTVTSSVTTLAGPSVSGEAPTTSATASGVMPGSRLPRFTYTDANFPGEASNPRVHEETLTFTAGSNTCGRRPTTQSITVVDESAEAARRARVQR